MRLAAHRDGKAQAERELHSFYSDRTMPPDVNAARRITFLRIEQLAQQCTLSLERQTSDSQRSARVSS